MFGVTCWEIVARDIPFKNLTLAQVAVGIATSELQLSIPSNCNPVLTQIIKQCWIINPDERPDFVQIVSMLKNWIV